MQQLRRQVKARLGMVGQDGVEGQEPFGDEALAVDEVVDGGTEPLRADTVEDGVGLAPGGEDAAQDPAEVGPVEAPGLPGRADVRSAISTASRACASASPGSPLSIASNAYWP